MGYYVDCIGGSLEIRSDMFKKAIELLSEGMTAEIPDDIVGQGKMLCKLTKEWDCNIESWLISYEDGGILFVKVWHKGGKWDSRTEDLYKLIAPAVPDGWWVAFAGEDAHVWRYKYWNGKCKRQYLDLRDEAVWN